MTIGEKIFELRTENEMSQDELAVELKVSRNTVSKWETGFMNPSADKIDKLCKVFGVPATYFFEDAEIAATEEDKPEEKRKDRKSLAIIVLLAICASAFIVGDILLAVNMFVPRGHTGGGDAIPAPTGPIPTASGSQVLDYTFLIIMLAITLVFFTAMLVQLYRYIRRKR